MTPNKPFRQDFLLISRFIYIYFLYFHQLNLAFSAHSAMTFICLLIDTTQRLKSKWFGVNLFYFNSQDKIRGKGTFIFSVCGRISTLSIHFFLNSSKHENICDKRQRTFFFQGKVTPHQPFLVTLAPQNDL